MLFFLEKGYKVALPTILFKFLMDSIRETRTGSTSKKGRFIPNGRLISDILVENSLLDDLLVSGLIDELVKYAGKIFRGKNLKSMGLISKIVRPNLIPPKDDIFGMRIPIENFQIFTKIDPSEVLEYYLESCLKDGIDPLLIHSTYHKLILMCMGRGRKSLDKKEHQDFKRIRRMQSLRTKIKRL